MFRPHRFVSSILLSGILLLPLACRRGNDSEAPAALAPATLASATLAPATPIVLISIDTLRSDRLPAYGYEGVETPAIDALRRDGILYERAYSPIPLTLPSHTSLLTGLLPAAHGVRDNVGYVLAQERVASGEIPYLPRLLQSRGYATGAAVSSFVLRGKMGLEEGFDLYEDAIEFRTHTGLGGLQRPGRETLQEARGWLESVADGPFFFFFHLYEPHTPYQPPEPFKSRYDSPYDGEIAAADAVVGELLDELRRLGVYDRALIFLTSDHGEGLGDHGEDEHGVLLYREAIQVPLILKLPEARMAGTTVTAPAQLLDVVPTLAALLDLPISVQLPGQSLFDLAASEAAPRRIYSETFYPRLHFGWSELLSLIDGQLHYIEGPDPELYDLTVDPGETRNVLAERRRSFAEMRDQLATYDRSLTAPAEVDEESRQALAALGYIGGGGGDLDGPLPDPKSRLGSLGDLRAAFRFYSERDYQQAADAFRKVIDDNPQMLDAWEHLARSLQKLGHSDEALAAYRQALAISKGAPHLAISAASLYFDRRELDEAEAHARLAIGTHPSFAHGLLAQIAFTRGDLATAESEARLAMDDKKPRLGPNITLAAIYHARQEIDSALELVRRTEQIFADRQARDPELIQGLFLLKGQILADLGRAEEATAAFAREIELFPEDLRAYTNLALLYGLTGRPEQVSEVLRRMVEAHPSAAAYVEAVKTLRALDYPGAAALLQFALGKFPQSLELRQLAAG